jgi:hypothetical protein
VIRRVGRKSRTDRNDPNGKALIGVNPTAFPLGSSPVWSPFPQMADCRAKVIFLSIYEGRDFLDAAFSAGASGYVNKARLSTDLIPAIHEAMLGRIFISAPQLMQCDRPPACA